MLPTSEYSIMKTIRNSIFLILIFSFSAFSQQNDFQNWSSFKLTKKIYKRTNVAVKQGLRLRENSSLLSKTFTDVKLSHRIKKTDLVFAVGYRFSDDYDIHFSSEYKQRYYFDFSSKYDYKRFKISLRDRLQYQGNNSSFKPLFRQKTELSYNVRKTPFEPYVQFEFFLNFEEQFEKLRYTAGFSYPILKKLNANLFYRIQQELNASNPENLFILGTSLSYKL